MDVFEDGPLAGPIAESRERIYGILEALLSHPDEGKWGRVVSGKEQRLAIEAADSLQNLACRAEYPLLPGELSSDELDLRFLMVELCQPLEHLKGEYERVLCTRRPRPGCSPFALDYHQVAEGIVPAEFLADLAGLYRSFGFREEPTLPGRPDHVAFEMGFMAFLIGQKRLVGRMVRLDPHGAEHFAGCDLAVRRFFSDHLSGWAVSFATGLRKNTGGGYFEPLGRFLAAWMPLERHYLGLVARSEGGRKRKEEIGAGIKSEELVQFRTRPGTLGLSL
jgi:TorA maturation chaperone TorD